MSGSITPVSVEHINVVLEDFDASVTHLRELYGAELVHDMERPEWHACLMSIGGVLFELFVPHHWLLNARYGPHYLGIEYQADVDQAREVLASRKIRVIRDIGKALHAHPEDCLGVAFEFWNGSFKERDWELLGGRMKAADHWRDEHPLGLTGLIGYTLAVWDIVAATRFLQGLLKAEVVYEEARPAVAARAVGLQVADAVCELLTPTDDGPIARHLKRFGQGIRSTVFGTCSLGQARRYFADHDIELAPGAAPNRLAVPAERNLGVIFEFSE